MGYFAAASITTATATATPGAEIIPGANNSYNVKEFGFTLNAAGTTHTIGIGRAAAAGVTPTSPITAINEDNADTTAGATTTATAWGTAPTVPSTFLRRVAMPATIGAGAIWTPPRGWKATKGASNANNNIVYWIITGTSAAVNYYFVVDE